MLGAQLGTWRQVLSWGTTPGSGREGAEEPGQTEEPLGPSA